MRKQLLAKLLVLGMVLAMLPVAALAASTDSTNEQSNEIYDYSSLLDAIPVVFDTPAEEDEEKTEEPETPAEPTAAETVGEVTTTTTEDGKVVATAAVEAVVADGAATVTVSEAAVKDLVAKLGDTKADVIVLTVDAKDASKATVALPATALAALAETEAGLTVKSTVATITVPKEILSAGFETVEITAEVKEDGTYAISVIADGKALQGIEGASFAVEIPVTVTADEIAAVYLVKADGTEVELEYEVVDGVLKANIEETGSIRVDKK